jgi:hypothetical protein
MGLVAVVSLRELPRAISRQSGHARLENMSSNMQGQPRLHAVNWLGKLLRNHLSICGDVDGVDEVNGRVCELFVPLRCREHALLVLLLPEIT